MDSLTALSLGRITLATISLTPPDVAGKLFGLDVEAKPSCPS